MKRTTFEASSLGLTRPVLSITALDELDDFAAHCRRRVQAAGATDPDMVTALAASEILLRCRNELRALSATDATPSG